MTTRLPTGTLTMLFTDIEAAWAAGRKMTPESAAAFALGAAAAALAVDSGVAGA